MRLLSWVVEKMGVSREVHEAMVSSAEGEARARAFRQEIREVIDPLRPVLDKNHFEDAVRQTFQRRAI